MDVSHRFQRETAIGLILLWLTIPPGLRAEAAGQETESVEFNRDIRPILSDHCFQCHGPDGSKRKAKLRLDLEESARGVLGGKAAVGGNLEASELYRRI